LKSGKGWNARKVVDAGYEAMIRAIRADKTPNLLVLQYTQRWKIQNLLLVPKFFLSESVIEKRRPLADYARRAGWVGCNILLSQIPLDGRITLVSSGRAAPRETVRTTFARVRRLANVQPGVRGWTLDVLRIVRKIGKGEFTLDEVYKFESELWDLHPLNRNVKPKIRQQLQVLRDSGFISFSAPGVLGAELNSVGRIKSMKTFRVRLETLVEAKNEQAALTHVFRKLPPDLFVDTEVEELGVLTPPEER
jgi:type II restriction enzyme